MIVIKFYYWIEIDGNLIKFYDDYLIGLDPAEPYFEHTEPMIRLDASDALFVDVIHTDAGPFIAGGGN